MPTLEKHDVRTGFKVLLDFRMTHSRQKTGVSQLCRGLCTALQVRPAYSTSNWNWIAKTDYIECGSNVAHMGPRDRDAEEAEASSARPPPHDLQAVPALHYRKLTVPPPAVCFASRFIGRSRLRDEHQVNPPSIPLSKLACHDSIVRPRERCMILDTNMKRSRIYQPVPTT